MGGTLGVLDAAGKAGRKIGSTAKDVLTNPDILIPILSGIGAFGSTGTTDLGSKLAAGIGAGAKSYQGMRQFEQDKAKTQADVAQTKTDTFIRLQEQAPKGMQVVEGADGPNAFRGPDGGFYHYVPTVNYLDMGHNTNPNPQNTSTSSISYDPKSKAYNIGPSSNADALLTRFGGWDPNANPVANIAKVRMLNPSFETTEATDTANSQERLKGAAQYQSNHDNLVHLVRAVNTISSGGLTGQGAGFEYRQGLNDVYQTVAKLIGLPQNEQDVSNLSEAQVIAKLKGLSAPQIAQQYGQESAAISNAINSVLPGGGTKLPAANSLFADMLVQNQRERDFATYYNAYVAKYGTAAYVQEAFKRDMEPTYAHERDTLPKILMRGNNGKQPSAFELLSTNPEYAQKLDEGFKTSDGRAVPGFGTGISRYGF
jgi:hypothetical protein